MSVFKNLMLCAVGALGIASHCSAGITPEDEVIHWNNVMLERFREDFGTGCPGPLARAGAMVQAAVFEAVNSIDREWEPYIDYVDAPVTASKEAAVIAAAYRTMLALFPNSTQELTSEYIARRSLIPSGAAKNQGTRVGNRAAAQIILERTGDGSETPIAYQFLPGPGNYVPSPPSFDPECNPEWGFVRPFAMERTTQFRPTLGPCGFQDMDALLRSQAYADQVNEVRALGRRYGSTRTDEQTQIAFFWANDRNGTYKPPGHLFSITQTVSRDQGLTLEQNARLFALVGLAMGDAAIVAWDAKYNTGIDLWRPIVAIRRANTDNNPLTVVDKRWNSLNPFAPAFPAWISGHATFGAAHAAVMAEFFGTDDITFTVDSEDPFYNALPSHPPRTFTSFSQAAVENGVSRIYLGVHYRMDATDGNAAGFALGRYVARNTLAERCMADFNRDGLRDSVDVDMYYSAYSANSMTADLNDDASVDMADLDMFMNAYLSGC